MGRYFIGISYNGANYSGWQTQNNAISIQATLQDAFRKALRQEITIVGSSRTDAGVHALYQVAQFDGDLTLDVQQVIFRVNMILPEDITVLKIFRVKSNARARYDALSRSYRYYISRKKNPFQVGRALFLYGDLDIDLMNECCQIILKTTDFQSFSKVNTQVNHFECFLTEAIWENTQDLLVFKVSANRFLRGMVRALVGTMLEVGRKKMTLEEFRLVVESKDRKKAGENVPACGLFLTHVAYPEWIRE